MNQRITKTTPIHAKDESRPRPCRAPRLSAVYTILSRILVLINPASLFGALSIPLIFCSPIGTAAFAPIHSVSVPSYADTKIHGPLYGSWKKINKKPANKETADGDPNDPRVMRRMRGGKQPKTATTAYSKAKKVREASAAFDLPEQPVVQTIGGGTAMIFAMAQRMWEQEKTTPTDSRNNKFTTTIPNNSLFLRWRPTSTQLAGISNFNPSFRTQAPDMNNQGYAGTIWRNVRKRNKPSLWRYALRTYDRMTISGECLLTGNDENGMPCVDRTNVHHQGALLATAKLGLWEKALEIYRSVEEKQEALTKGSKNVNKWKLPVHVTDGMLVSLIYACVRASRSMSSTEASWEERRRPLDAACQVLEEVESRHCLAVESRHYNPLAAAYQRLKLRSESQELIDRLKDRKTGPEPEDGPPQFNINDLSTKNKGSYTLLVTGAVQEEDWEGAVDALRNMTEAGLYPNQRHLNVWTEVSERKTKHRTTRSWKKKRDEVWIERGLR